jgi:hypothetical protein
MPQLVDCQPLESYCWLAEGTNCPLFVEVISRSRFGDARRALCLSQARRGTYEFFPRIGTDKTRLCLLIEFHLPDKSCRTTGLRRVA